MFETFMHTSCLYKRLRYGFFFFFWGGLILGIQRSWMWLCRVKMKHTLGIFRRLLVISLACKTYLWLCMCVERERYLWGLCKPQVLRSSKHQPSAGKGENVLVRGMESVNLFEFLESIIFSIFSIFISRKF